MEQRDTFAIVPLWLIELASPPALRLYAWIGAKYASGAAGTAWPSQSTLATDLNTVDRSVRRWLDELAELGAIKVQHRPGTSSVTTLIARTAPPSARTPDMSVRGTPDTGVRYPGHECPDSADTSVRRTRRPINQSGATTAGGGAGGGAVNPTRTAAEVRAADEAARAEAAGPETARAALAEARDRARSKGRHPSTGPNLGGDS